MPRFAFWPFVWASLDWLDQTVVGVITYLATHPLAFVAVIAGLLLALFGVALSALGRGLQQMDADDRAVVVPFTPAITHRRIPVTDRAAYDRMVQEAEAKAKACVEEPWERSLADVRASIAKHRASSSGSEVA